MGSHQGFGPSSGWPVMKAPPPQRHRSGVPRSTPSSDPVNHQGTSARPAGRRPRRQVEQREALDRLERREMTREKTEELALPSSRTGAEVPGEVTTCKIMKEDCDDQCHAKGEQSPSHLDPHDPSWLHASRDLVRAHHPDGSFCEILSKDRVITDAGVLNCYQRSFARHRNSLSAPLLRVRNSPRPGFSRSPRHRRHRPVGPRP